MSEKFLKKRELILHGNLWKAVIVLSLPAAITGLIRALYGLVDIFVASNIGDTELAAITFVQPIDSFVLTMSVGLSIAATSLIGREIGRNNFDKAKGVAMQILIIGLAIGLSITLFTFVFSKAILTRAYVTDNIFHVANVYFRITVLRAPLMFFNAIYVAIKRAEGDTLRAMVVNMMGVIIKGVLSIVLVYLLGYGVRALALSSIIGALFVTLVGMYDLFLKKGALQLSLKYMHFTLQFFITLLIIALPVIIEKSSLSFSQIVIHKYVLEYGEDVLSAFGITNRINSLLFASVTGFASGLSPIISQNLGSNNEKRAKKAATCSFVLAVGIATVIILIMLPFKESIVPFFTNGNDNIEYHTINAISVFSISVIPWAVFQVANGVFQGTGHTTYNLVISIARIYLIRLPLVILLTKYTDLAEYSIWYCMLYSNLITAFVAYMMYLYRRRNFVLSKDSFRFQKKEIME